MPSSIWTATDAQLSSAQAKVTYLGEQTKVVPSVAFSVAGHRLAMVRFLDVQRSRRPYINDESLATKQFAVPVDVFRRILLAVRPIVTPDEERGPEFLSFTVVTGAGAALVGEEHLIGQAKGKKFYTALLQALPPDEAQAQNIIRAQFRNVYPQQ